MQFGSVSKTQVIDDEGSTATRAENVRNGVSLKPVRVDYRIRKRVTSQSEEHTEYMYFSDLVSKDQTILDPAFEIERSRLGNENGYYYVIQCYTRLEAE